MTLGTSCGFTGSARRTSGSDVGGCAIGDGTATVGSVTGVTPTAGVGLGWFSTGEARGAMIVSGAAVAVGEIPMTA